MIVHYSYFGIGVNTQVISYTDGIGVSVVTNGFSSQGLRESMKRDWISVLESNTPITNEYRYYVLATLIRDDGKIIFHKAIINPKKLFTQ